MLFSTQSIFPNLFHGERNFNGEFIFTKNNNTMHRQLSLFSFFLINLFRPEFDMEKIKIISRDSAFHSTWRHIFTIKFSNFKHLRVSQLCALNVKEIRHRKNINQSVNCRAKVNLLLLAVMMNIFPPKQSITCMTTFTKL